jgi:UDP-N-acetylmuramate: L-alanyl-gamma-D-glutamyl-meso-diaminopimelate ligase
MLKFESLIENNKDVKKIFMYRICGTGMGACACLLKEKGFHIEGGDNNFYPPMSTYLESTGIPLKNLSEIDKEYLRSFDLIVVGNVVPRNSDDAKLIESLDVPFTSFPTALGALVLNDVNVVGIAGTHGKTTTTYFMTQVFEALGEDPGYLIGGVMEGRPSAKLGNGKYFFIESDEYDSAYFEKFSKFRSYSLNHMILTSLEFDHADIFSDIEDIKKEFRAAIPGVNGTHIYNTDYKATEELISEMQPENLQIYGDNSNQGPELISESEKGTTFKIKVKNEWEEFETNLIGEHNILNLSSVIFFALSEGIAMDKLKNVIKDLGHVKRRQEVRGTYKQCTVIDDFAHHPRAVDLTVAGIKTKYSDREIVVVMEPNSATARSSLFQKEFLTSLKNADQVIFAKPSRPTSISGVADLDGEKIIDGINESGRKGTLVSNLEDLLEAIDKAVSPNTLFLILSNGTCLGLWESEFVNQIQK